MWASFLSLCLFCPGSMAFAGRVLVTGERRPTSNNRVHADVGSIAPIFLCSACLLGPVGLRLLYSPLTSFPHFSCTSLLLLGGAGYIGSHTCVELIKAGEKVRPGVAVCFMAQQ